MSVHTWIRNAFEANGGFSEESKETVYSLYSKFVKDNESAMSEDSYRRRVREVYAQNSPTEEYRLDEEKGWVRDTIIGNERTVSTCYNQRITNLDTLIQYCHINLDEWYVDRCEINKWEVGRRNKEHDLTWDEGKVSGTSRDHGGFDVEPLIQVKATLIRRVLKPLNLEPICSVQVNLTQFLDVGNLEKDVKTAVVISDLHIGYHRDLRTGKLIPLHDRKAICIALATIKRLQPDVVVLNGDMFDMSDWTDKYIVSPDFRFHLQPALVEIAWLIGQIRAMAPNTGIEWIGGNHDARLKKHMLRHLSEVYELHRVGEDRVEQDGFGVVSLPHLLQFHKIGVNWRGIAPDAHLWLNDQIRLSHEEYVPFKEATFSEGYGHDHRILLRTKTIDMPDESSRVIMHASFGTFANIGRGMQIPRAGKRVNWQQGFGIIYFDDSFFEVLQVKIDRNNAFVSGERYVGSDYVDQLVKDTGWDSLKAI